MDELLDERAMADFCGISVKTLQRWRWCGGEPGLPFVKIGRLVRYERKTVEDWIASRQRRSTSDPGPEAPQDRQRQGGR